MRVAMFAAALVLAGCPLSPQAPPVDPVPPDWPASPGDAELHEDGSSQAAASPCGRACENFRRVGCSDGQPTSAGVTCYRACVLRARLVRIPSRCWASAASVDAVRACGGVRCL